MVVEVRQHLRLNSPSSPSTMCVPGSNSGPQLGSKCHSLLSHLVGLPLVC